MLGLAHRQLFNGRMGPEVMAMDIWKLVIPIFVSAIGVAFSGGVALASLKMMGRLLELQLEALTERFNDWKKVLESDITELRDDSASHATQLDVVKTKTAVLESQVGSLRDMRRVTLGKAENK